MSAISPEIRRSSKPTDLRMQAPIRGAVYSNEINHSGPIIGEIQKSSDTQESKIVLNSDYWVEKSEITNVTDRQREPFGIDANIKSENPQAQKSQTGTLQLPIDFQYKENDLDVRNITSPSNSISNHDLGEINFTFPMGPTNLYYPLDGDQYLIKENFDGNKSKRQVNISVIGGSKPDDICQEILDPREDIMTNNFSKGFIQGRGGMLKKNFQNDSDRGSSTDSKSSLTNRFKPIKINKIQSVVRVDDSEYQPESSDYFSISQGKQNSPNKKNYNGNLSDRTEVYKFDEVKENDINQKSFNSILRKLVTANQNKETSNTHIDLMEKSQMDICLVLPYLYEGSEGNSSFRHRKVTKRSGSCENDHVQNALNRQSTLPSKGTKYENHSTPGKINLENDGVNASLMKICGDLDIEVSNFEDEVKDLEVDNLDLIFSYLELSLKISNEIVENYDNLAKIHVDIVSLTSIISSLDTYGEKFHSINRALNLLRKILINSNAKKNTIELQRTIDKIEKQKAKSASAYGSPSKPVVPKLALNRMKSDTNAKPSEQYFSTAQSSAKGGNPISTSDRMKIKGHALQYKEVNSNVKEEKNQLLVKNAKIQQNSTVFTRKTPYPPTYSHTALKEIVPGQWSPSNLDKDGKIFQRSNRIRY